MDYQESKFTFRIGNKSARRQTAYETICLGTKGEKMTRKIDEFVK